VIAATDRPKICGTAKKKKKKSSIKGEFGRIESEPKLSNRALFPFETEQRRTEKSTKKVSLSNVEPFSVCLSGQRFVPGRRRNVPHTELRH
jgi:hypothetical protein